MHNSFKNLSYPAALIYGQLSDTTSAQREWENQDQERNTTGGHHLAQAVHGIIGEHI